MHVLGITHCGFCLRPYGTDGTCDCKVSKEIKKIMWNMEIDGEELSRVIIDSKEKKMSNKIVDGVELLRMIRDGELKERN